MKKRIFAILLSLAIISFGAIAINSNAAPEVNQAAVDYLKTKDNSAWKTMALSVAGESELTGEHLKNITSENAIDYCAPTLAITALGEDPRTYPAQDYVSKLKNFWDSSQLGDAATLNDDIFGLLALISSGEPNSDSVVTGIKNYLISQQNQDNGWGFATDGGSDTNMTSAAIMALLESGVSASDSVITNAVAYLQNAQNDDGGFPYDPISPWGTDSDASSDAWVISAIYALGQNPETWIKNDHNPIEHLKSLQAEAGYFKYQPESNEDAFSPITTSYAITALAGKSYPVGKITIVPTQKFGLRIEGSFATICKNEFLGPTALDIIKNASEQCGFTYEIEETEFGPYLKKINDQEAEGMDGWMYFVNNISPMVGAGDYILEENDEVLWYFGEWGWKPLKIQVNQTEVPSGATIVATVSYYNESWEILENATIQAGVQNFTTNPAGAVDLSLEDNYYRIYAEKDNYVRSDKILVKFGEPETQDVNLEVNIVESEEPGPAPGPSPEPSEVSFSIDVSEVNFGNLNPGQISTQDINITNQSDNDMYIESIVSGNDIFQDNMYLDSASWENFNLNLLQGENHDTELKLSIPASYSNFGAQTGAITFWAIVE